MSLLGRRQFLVRALHIFALANLSVAHPLYQVLAAAPEFFVAHRATAIDLLLLAVLLSGLLPAALAALVWIAGRFSTSAGTAVHLLVLGALGFTLALQVARRLNLADPAPALVFSSVAAVVAVAVTAYARSAPVRTFATLLAPAIIVVPLWFLARPAIRTFMFPQARQGAKPGVPSVTPPIVVVAFDQLPLASLLDADGRIDRNLYPGFAALADRATWFRNATGVADYTGWALPPILTGSYPRRRALPTAADYPDSLFTLLAGTYRMNVFEPITSLCPESICPPDREPLPTRVAAMVADEAVIFLHIVFPKRLAAMLPPISQDWKNFAANARWLSRWTRRRLSDRRTQPNRFIQLIQQGRNDRPTLYVLHALFPHEPYIYERSGREFALPGGVPGLDAHERWTGDEWEVIQGYQAHLVQLEYADALVTRILGGLKQAGLLDAALIVVTADHGARFRPGEIFKWMTALHPADVASVPLLVKLPGQRTGTVSDRNVETIDVTPTIAAALGVKLPWEHDGSDALDARVPERPQKLVFTAATTGFTRLRNVIGDELHDAVAWKLSLFRNGDPRVPVRAPHVELIGRPVAGLPGGAPWTVRIAIEAAYRYADIDPGADFVPARLTGEVPGSADSPDPLALAIAVNGVVQATTWTRPRDGTWSALVPIDSFRRGPNDIRVFVVQGIEESIVLRPAADARRPADLNLLSDSAKRDWNVGQSGFYDVEGSGDGSYRWTNGAASLDVPNDPTTVPKAINVDVAMTGPRPSDLRIMVNGCQVYRGRINGAWSHTFSLAQCPPNGRRVRIDFLSDVFHTKTDPRTLGIAMRSATLLAADSR